MTRISLLLLAGISAFTLASAARAADLIVETPAAPMIAETTSGAWDGPYAGIFGGYGVGEAYDPDSSFTLDLDGTWIGGFILGADFTVSDNIVLGIAGDLTYLGLDGIADPAGANVAFDLYWGGSLRGKIGYDAGAFLPYLTAGLAVGSAELEGSGTTTGSDSNTHVGWTAGAGLEIKVTDNASIDLLYKYTDYLPEEYTLSSGTSSVGFTTHTVTAGLNWRF